MADATNTVVGPSATNPDARPGVDPSADPNQVVPSGNPAPKAPPAKEPKPDDKKADPEPKPDDKPKEEPKPDPNVEDDKPLDTTVWGDTGHEDGNAVLTLLQNSGVSQDDAKAILFDAVRDGDLTKIDRAKLEEKVGKVKAQLIVTGATAFIKDQKAAAEAIVTTLHTEVGGKDNWSKVADWAKKAMPDDQLGEYRDMINAGGLKATLAAKAMKEAYEGDQKNSSLTIREVVPKSGGTPEAIQPLSKTEYLNALEKLHATHNGRPPAHLRQQLLTARETGKKLGR